MRSEQSQSVLFVDDDDLSLAYDMLSPCYLDNPVHADDPEEYEDAACLPLRRVAGRVVNDLSAGGLLIALERQASDVSSSWSAVSAAESEWTIVCDEVLQRPLLLASALAWDLGDDAAIARQLQEAECAALFTPPPHGATPPTPTHRRAVRAQRAPSIGMEALAVLREACGRCVVCMDALATCAWEPCGHLALCEACHESLVGAVREHCVVCRTPGRGVFLMRPRAADDQEAEDVVEEEGPRPVGVSICASDGTLALPSSAFAYRAELERCEEEERMGKLEWRRAKRMLSRMRRQVVVPQRWKSVRGAGCRDRCLFSMWPAYRLSGGLHSAVPRLLTSYTPLPASDLLKANRFGVYMASKGGVSSEKRRLRMLVEEERRGMRELKHAVQAEEVRMQRWLERLTREAEARSATVGGRCRGVRCAEAHGARGRGGGDGREACMMPLRCGHVTLCRECWEARNEEALCVECGASCHLAIQIFKPLGACAA
jgi:hypothetical protein